MKIHFITTGGTIDKVYFDAKSEYEIGSPQVAEVLKGANVAFDFEIESVLAKDSLEMTEADRRLIRERVSASPCERIVVTHGTDTLEETAYFLHAVLAPAKPVVLTCAMRPATALLADGPQNLADAMAVSASAGARGVVAVCAGTIHNAVDVAKLHTYRLDAFDSGDAGPIGYVEDGRLRLVRDWPAAGDRAPAVLEKIARATRWPRVEIVLNYAGAVGATVDALVAQGVDGLVVAGTGNGSVHRELEKALLAAQAAGVRVVRSTRCAQGRVQPVEGDTLPDSGGLSPVKARVALMLELMK